MEGSNSCTPYDLVLAVKVEPVEEHLSPDGTRVHVRDALSDHNYFKDHDDEEDITETTLVIGRPGEDYHEHPSCSYSQADTSALDDKVCVKTEPSDSAGPRGVSEAAMLAGLYTDHVVKEELVLGPERPHRPLVASHHDELRDVSTWSQESAREPCDDLPLMEYSVKLERYDPCDTTRESASQPSAEHTVPQIHDTVPHTTDDIVPQNTQNAVAQNTHHTVPQNTHDTVPQNTQNTVAQNTNDTVPQNTHDTVPQNTHDTVPQNTQNTVAQNTHNTLQHAATNTYVCDICGKRIKRKDHLIRHINMHLRENSETLSNKLNIYERVRTSDNPYSCKICKREFTRLDNLQRHERIHTGEKTHSCAICKKQFAQLCNLTAHKRIHTGEKPYSCNICKMQFAELGTLKKHKRIHTGEKSYACEVCSKVFAYFTTLKRHKRIYTGAKPYTCEICKEGFMRLDTLKTHLISHMGNKSKVKEKKPRKGKVKATHDK